MATEAEIFGGQIVNAGPVNDAAPLYDPSYFLHVFDRILDDSYIGPLREAGPGSGYEVLKAFAAMGGRASLSAYRMEADALVCGARGPLFATGTVRLTRSSTAAGAVTIQRGSVFTASKSGRRFVSSSDVTIGALALFVDVPITADTPGYEWNLPGEIALPSGSTLPGEIDTITTCYQSPAYAEPNLTIRQIDPTMGGTSGSLDGLGADRGITRSNGETDDAFKLRIRTLPDTVSPGAIVRTCHRVLDPLGIPFYMIEAGDATTITAWSWSPSNIGTGTLSPGQVTLNYATLLREFAIVVGLRGNGEIGTFLDTAAGATDTNAIDLYALTDGYPVIWAGALLSLIDQIDRTRAAGVAWRILIDTTL